MALNYVTITGSFLDGSDSPVNGTVTFTPSETVYSSGVPVASVSNPVTATISNGSLQASFKLLATDNTLVYEGLTGFFYWTAQVVIAGVAQTPWSFFLPHAPSTVDLYALANTAASGGGGFTSPMTTLGDMLYENATPAAARLAGSTSATKNFLTQTGTGSVSAAPAWGTIAAADVPGFDGVTVTGTPISGMVPTATGSSAATWQSPASVYGPNQFHIAAAGAKSDGKLVSDGAITASTAALACATSTPFASGDVGKAIMVIGAGAAGADLLTTIQSFTDSGHVTLAANAGTTVSAKGVIFGTDDTAAVKTAKTNAVAYAQAHPGQGADVLIPDGITVLAGAATVGATFEGNAIIPLPLVATSAPKVTLRFLGLGSDVTALPHWQQTVPEMSGATLAVLRLDGTNDVTYGPASVIGGPINGYGGISSLFTNVHAIVDNIRFSVPLNSTFGGLDFLGVAEATVYRGSCQARAVVPSGAAWPQLSYGSISNVWSYGLRMPDVNNNDKCDVGYWSCEGMTYGFMPSEHTTALSVRTHYCIVGVQGYASSPTPHGAHVFYVSSEANNQACGVLSTGANLKIDIDQIDYESNGTQYLLFDTANLYVGTIQFRNVGTGYLVAITNGGSQARMINLDQPRGPVASPQAPPASGSAWVNYYYRDAWITLSATTSVTALSIDSTAQLITAGAKQAFLLPAGHSYTPAYTGTLTHTVTLL